MDLTYRQGLSRTTQKGPKNLSLGNPQSLRDGITRDSLCVFRNTVCHEGSRQPGTLYYDIIVYVRHESDFDLLFGKWFCHEFFRRKIGNSMMLRTQRTNDKTWVSVMSLTKGEKMLLITLFSRLFKDRIVCRPTAEVRVDKKIEVN